MASSGVATSAKSIFGFDPRTVPGCQLWLDAADPATLTFSSGNIISTWKDKSTNAVTLTAFGNPTTTTVNGRTSISLNGSTQYLQRTAFTPTNSATYVSWFAVANVTNYAGVTYACIVGTNYPSNNFSQNTLYINSGVGVIYYRNANAGTNKALSSGAVTTNTVFQTETDYVTGQYQINLNGAGLVSKTDGLTGAIDTATVNLQVGWDSYSGDSYVAGTISECLLFTSPVSPANKRAIEGYLAWKWGLQNSLVNAISLTPLSISGCSIWLDASDTASVFQDTGGVTASTNGTKVALWKDKSGNNRNATQITSAATNPTYTTGQQNGLPGIYFNSSSGLNLPTLNLSPITIFLVAKSTTYTYGVMFISFTSSSGIYLRAFYGDVAPTYTSYGIDYGSSAYRYTTQVANTDTNPHVWSFSLPSSGFGQFLFDGVDGTTSTGFTASQIGASSSSISIGCYGQIPTNGLNGYINEIIIYNSALRKSQIRQIELYLSFKWGITTNKSNAHQYSQLIPYSRSLLPLDIPGCTLWLDAADRSTLTLINSGANVSVWKDKSGNSYDCSISSGANGPGYSSSTQGLQFRSASSQSLVINQLFGNALVNTTFTIFCVGQRVSSGTFNLFLAGSPQTAFQTLQIGFNGVNTMNLNMFSIYYETTITSYVAGAEPINIYTYELNTTNIALFLNGLRVLNTANTTRLAAFTTPEIGRRYGGSGAQTYHDFNLFEMIAYTRSLTEGQRQQIEGYLANKWGIQSSLGTRSTISTFSYTGAIQTFTVPSGVTTLTVTLSGGGGGSGNNQNTNGGSGALVSGTITVTPGQVLTVIVGQGGMSNRGSATGGSASFGGGGAGGSYTPGGVAGSGAGGGRSAIQNNSGVDLVSAGGGGGGGGGNTGSNGGLVGGGFNGGTQSSGGAGSGTTYKGSSGTGPASSIITIQGGAGFTNNGGIGSASTGGGGGGGYYGGGGGGIGDSGGGGSSLCPSGTSATTGGGGAGGSSSTPNGDGINGSITITGPTNLHPFSKIPATSPSLFSPTNIGACAIWIDGNDPYGTGVVPASGATFAMSSATIIDKSGNGYNLTPTATINYSTQFLNNMGVLNFGSARAQNSSFNWTTNFTQFVVVKGATGSWGTSYINPTGTIYWSYIYANNNNLMVVGVSGGAAVFNVMDGVQGNSISTFTNTGKGVNAWTIFCIGYTPGSTGGVNYTLNGTSYVTQTGTPFNSSLPTNLTLTLNGNLAGHYDTNVYVAEFIHYNARLSTTQRQQVEGYLAGKWGLQGLLPTTHPSYESIPAAVSSYYFYESFELPASTGFTWSYSVPWNEWAVTGISKAGVGSPWDPAGGTAAAGSWYAYIQGNGTTASRVFQGPVGYTATLSFSYGYRVGTTLVTSVSVTWTPLGGSAVTLPGSPFAMPSSATPWTTVTTSFVFTASSGTLIFTNNSSTGDPSVLLDNILIT